MNTEDQHTAMLLVLGKPDLRTVGNEWYAEADHWLCDQGIPTPGARRTIINSFVTWVMNTEGL